MKRLKKICIIGVFVLALAVGTVMPFLPRIAVGLFAGAYNLDITYGSIAKATPGEMVFSNLAIIDKKKGLGITSQNAAIRPLWKNAGAEGLGLEFNLKNVRFVKKTAGKAASYNNLDGLVALPFSSDFVYNEVSGKVSSRNDDTIIRDFLAKCDDIKLSFNGTLSKKGAISSDIVIFFSDALTQKIPKELSDLALNKEADGWKSLSVKVEGDFSAPRVQVSSKLFRLNIAVKETEGSHKI